jgi:hypothetical protein
VSVKPISLLFTSQIQGDFSPAEGPPPERDAVCSFAERFKCVREVWEVHSDHAYPYYYLVVVDISSCPWTEPWTECKRQSFFLAVNDGFYDFVPKGTPLHLVSSDCFKMPSYPKGKKVYERSA